MPAYQIHFEVRRPIDDHPTGPRIHSVAGETQELAVLAWLDTLPQEALLPGSIEILGICHFTGPHKVWDYLKPGLAWG